MLTNFAKAFSFTHMKTVPCGRSLMVWCLPKCPIEKYIHTKKPSSAAKCSTLNSKRIYQYTDIKWGKSFHPPFSHMWKGKTIMGLRLVNHLEQEEIFWAVALHTTVSEFTSGGQDHFRMLLTNFRRFSVLNKLAAVVRISLASAICNKLTQKGLVFPWIFLLLKYSAGPVLPLISEMLQYMHISPDTVACANSLKQLIPCMHG